MPRLIKKGKINFLRAHELGTKFGPGSDQIDVEVVVKLDTFPDEAYGFQLRDDARGPAHRAMFELLRDGYNLQRTVQLEVDIDSGKKNGLAIRVTVLPAPIKPVLGEFDSVIGGAVVVNPIG